MRLNVAARRNSTSAADTARVSPNSRGGLCLEGLEDHRISALLRIAGDPAMRARAALPLADHPPQGGPQ
jgi:hypothetical protein